MSKNATEMAAKVSRMLGAGLPVPEIADRLGLTSRQVNGYIGYAKAQALRDMDRLAGETASRDSVEDPQSVGALLLKVTNVPVLMDLRNAMILKAQRIVTVADETNPDAARVQFSLAWECIDMAEGILHRLIDYAKSGDLGNV